MQDFEYKVVSLCFFSHCDLFASFSFCSRDVELFFFLADQGREPSVMPNHTGKSPIMPVRQLSNWLFW